MNGDFGFIFDTVFGLISASYVVDCRKTYNT